MFTNNIKPVIFKAWIFQIRYYGIIYALGFIISYFFLRNYIKNGRLKSIEINRLDELLIYMIIGVVTSARIFSFVFYEPGTLLSSPLEIFMIWRGGLSFHGGVIGAVIAAFIFSKRYKVRFMEIADAFVVPASLALALGRIGNFTNQELVGRVSNLPWCVRYMGVDGICRHPYQIYASLSHLIMFLILIYIYKSQKREGTTFWSFIFIYGIFRIFTDVFREEVKYFGMISTGQILCIIMIIAGLSMLIKEVRYWSKL